MNETAFRVRPVTLSNQWVSLEPLRPAHAPDLFHAGHSHPDLEFQPSPPFTKTMDGATWVTSALDDQLAGNRVPFAIINKPAKVAVGSTSLFDFRPAERALEIGYTWVTPTAHRTPINTAAKLLLLTHCFETLGCKRVQLKTDARNTISQRAIERLGATREGVLRRHMKLHDGFIRDTVYYSILPEEWPEIKKRLAIRLEA
ncbi:MAG: GNAT family N-acetyltransferase [Opitutaceae bacterium]|mgnify:CR=1 FL=1|jgi:N-acetyltransferase|nr:GNAT family N-acetyltransferase [Opitutaceae bacterium]